MRKVLGCGDVREGRNRSRCGPQRPTDEDDTEEVEAKMATKITRVTCWKRGDVVRLKSGGPKMTVMGLPDITDMTTQYSMTVAWFDGGVLVDANVDSEAVRHAR